MKRVEDVPHASANAVAIVALLKLSLITGKDEYLREAGRGLRVFAGTARVLGVHGGTYLCALSGYFHQATLTIESSAAGALAKEARAAAVRSFSTVRYGPDNGRVIPCTGSACVAPFEDAADLAAWHSGPAEMPSRS